MAHNNSHTYAKIHMDRPVHRRYPEGGFEIWKAQHQETLVAPQIPCCSWLHCLLFSLRRRIEPDKGGTRKELKASDVASVSWWWCKRSEKRSNSRAIGLFFLRELWHQIERILRIVFQKPSSLSRDLSFICCKIALDNGNA